MKSSHQFETNIPQLIQRLGVNLYNDKFICLRELVQNASDACLIAEGALGVERGRIDIDIDSHARTIVVSDTGIGMTESELHKYLSTIAASRKSAIRRELADKFEGSSGIAGRFGIGFLAVFIVSDDVQVYTRHHNESSNGYIWHSKGDGTYTVEPSPKKLAKGTTIRVKIRDDASELLSSEQLINTLKHHCPFIRTPYFVNRSALSVNHDLPPWYRGAAADAGRTYLLQSFSCDPIIELQIHYDGPWQPGSVTLGNRYSRRRHSSGTISRIRMDGYFAIPNKSVQYKSDRCSIYTSGLFVGSVHDSLPDWANFIVGGAECPDLDLTLGRDNVMENPYWWGAQEVLKAELTRSIVASLVDRRPKVRRAWAEVFKIHREQILRAGVDERKGYFYDETGNVDAPFFSAVKDLIPFNISGDWLSLDEIIQQKRALSKNDKTLVFYQSAGARPHESAGIQEAILFEEAGLHFIDARNYYERDFIMELDKSRTDVDLVPAEDAIPYIVSPTNDEANKRRVAELYKAIGVEATLCRFQPSSVSAIIAVRPDRDARMDRLDPQDPEALERIISALSQNKSRVTGRPYTLILNEESDLIQRLLEHVSTRGGDALSTQLLRQIYFAAVLVFGDRDFSTIAEIVPSMASTMASFFGHLGESERELQRVRKLAEGDRVRLQQVSEKLNMLDPPDRHPRSIFLSYSFDEESKRLVEPLRMMLRGSDILVIDGQADQSGSLSRQIVQKIRSATMFVGVMTPRGDMNDADGRDASLWVMEEKGAAIALAKPTLMLCDNSIKKSYLSKLDGDNVWLSSDGTAGGWLARFTEATEIIKKTLDREASAAM